MTSEDRQGTSPTTKEQHWLPNLLDHVLARLNDGSFFRHPLQVLYVVAGGAILLTALLAIGGGLVALIGELERVGTRSGSQGSLRVLAFVIASAILGFTAAVGAGIWWKRRKDLDRKAEYGNDFQMAPFVAHLVRTATEAYGCMAIALTPGPILLWGILSLLDAPFGLFRLGDVSKYFANQWYVYMLPGAGFLIIVAGRYLAEVIHVLFAIANNTRSLRNDRPALEVGAVAEALLPPVRVGWRTIGLILLAELVLLLPPEEGWSMMAIVLLMYVAWTSGWRWTQALLFPVGLLSALIWLYRMSAPHDMEQLFSHFMAGVWAMRPAFLFLKAVVLLVLFLERAGHLGKPPTLVRMWLVAGAVSLGALTYPIYRTVDEQSKRHTLTPGERQAAFGMFEAYSSHSWSLVQGQDLESPLPLSFGELKVFTDRYGNLSMEHRLLIDGAEAVGSYATTYMQLARPAGLDYSWQGRMVNVNYASTDSLLVRLPDPRTGMQLVRVGLPTEELERRRRLEQATVLVDEARLDSLRGVEHVREGVLMAVRCDERCVAVFRMADENGDSSLVRLESPFQEYDGIQLVSKLGRDLGEVAVPELRGLRFMVRSRLILDDVEVGAPLNTLMLKEELHGLELLDKRPESKEEQPASKQPLSERSEEEKPKGNALPDKVDVTASFPGGEGGRMQFLRKNLNYPDEDRAAGRVGKVFVEVVVEADGRLTNARIAEGATPSMNDEALRLVGLMPPWEPAQKNGKSVRSKVLVQIPFTLR